MQQLWSNYYGKKMNAQRCDNQPNALEIELKKDEFKKNQKSEEKKSAERALFLAPSYTKSMKLNRTEIKTHTLRARNEYETVPKYVQ